MLHDWIFFLFQTSLVCILDEIITNLFIFLAEILIGTYYLIPIKNHSYSIPSVASNPGLAVLNNNLSLSEDITEQTYDAPKWIE